MALYWERPGEVLPFPQGLGWIPQGFVEDKLFTILTLMLRVWRENRDRIVGWYDRFVYWNPKERVWYYSWDVSCEPSLALTGAAFYHKVCTCTALVP